MANATSRLFVLGLLAALPVTAGDSRRGSGEKPIPDVVVYVADSNVVPTSVLLQAEATATRMFAGIGLKLRWRERRPGRSGEAAGGTGAARRTKEIGVRMAVRKPATASSEAFASANPYAREDEQITLFYGELHEATRHQPRIEPTVLAHVLVHELTHVLQGVARHSETGVMQPHWTLRDYSAMERSPLEFTGEDADLVYLGLGKKERKEVDRLDTADYRIEMTVRFFSPYLGRQLSFRNASDPNKVLCYSRNSDSSPLPREVRGSGRGGQLPVPGPEEARRHGGDVSRSGECGDTVGGTG